MGSVSISTKRRLFFLLIVATVACLGLIARLFYIQIIDADRYEKYAFNQHIQDRIIPAKRGNIVDANGKKLAVSVSANMITANPSQITDKKAVATKLSELLKMDYDTVFKKVSKSSRYEIVARQIDQEVGKSIQEWIASNKIVGVFVDEDSKRVYPNNSLASHIIGYTGVDNQGLDGIEKIMDEYLKGVSGRIVSESDVKGRDIPFKTEQYIDAQNGYNVVLTIDEVIQHFAEQSLETAMIDNKVMSGGMALVMDVKTGDLLAMVSKPDFNLNDPKAKPAMVDQAVWDAATAQQKIEMLQKTVWRDRAVVNSYEPGSTFKIITASAGVEEGIVSLDAGAKKEYNCSGYYTVAGANIKCWRFPLSHGSQNLMEGLQNSCNPVFMQLGQKLGVDRFYKYTKAFGFGDKTGIVLPGEEKGIFHNIKDVGPVELATISFGQRFQVTPLQMVSAVSSVANGGKLMKPRLIKEIVGDDNTIIKKYEPEVVRQVISEKTSAEMCIALQSVVTYGTGKNAYVKGYRMAGKTGTSEKGVNTGKYIASFVAFAPADDPRICILVVLDEPEGPSHMGGVIAGPVVRKIAEDTLRYLEVEPKFSEQDAILSEVPVPDVRGMKVADARKLLSQDGLSYALEGGDGKGDVTIVEQMPRAGAYVSPKSKVVLYLVKSSDVQQVVVPDVAGLGMLQASDRLSDSGLNIKISGMGEAVKQTPAAGTSVPRGSVVTVDFMQLGDSE